MMDSKIEIELTSRNLSNLLDRVPFDRKQDYENRLKVIPAEHHSTAINAFLNYELQVEDAERESEGKRQALQQARNKLRDHLKQATANGRAR